MAGGNTVYGNVRPEALLARAMAELDTPGRLALIVNAHEAFERGETLAQWARRTLVNAVPRKPDELA